MTYCFVFNAEPDGVGIVADTRISDENANGELEPRPGDALKFYLLRDRAFVAIAGRVDHVAMILHGIRDALFALDPADWYDAFVAHAEKTFQALCAAGVFTRHYPPEAAIIYADIRHKRGETRCRVIRMEFGLADGGPVCVRRIAPPGNWVAIGWTPEGRRELSVAASAALGELNARGLKVSELSEAEVRQFHKSPVGAGELRGVTLDSTGAGDGSWREALRDFSKRNFLQGGATLPVEPILVMCSAVMAAVQGRMARLRIEALPYSEGVGDLFAAASLTQRHGFHVYSHAELQPIPLVVEAVSARSRRNE